MGNAYFKISIERRGIYMKKFLIISSAIVSLVLITPLLFAQNIEVADTCDDWQTIAAKIPSPNVSIKLSTNKEGEKLLQWSSPNGNLVCLKMHKAKAPIDTKGEITICNTGEMSLSHDTFKSISDLQKIYHLSGYYALCITSQTGDKQFSDWVVIQIK
jgi:hypothetical protein